MAGTDPPKNLISLIRNFASEKSQGGNHFLYIYHICFLFVSRENTGKEMRIKLKFPIESNLFLFLHFLCKIIGEFYLRWTRVERRVVGLKKQIEDLRSELEAANSELEEAKRLKETTEQELKGFEFELSLKESSIQALEVRCFYVYF